MSARVVAVVVAWNRRDLLARTLDGLDSQERPVDPDSQIARQVRAEGQPAAERYVNFLKAGGSVYPIDALKAAGVDLRDPAPVQAAFDILAGYVDRLEQLAG